MYLQLKPTCSDPLFDLYLEIDIPAVLTENVSAGQTAERVGHCLLKTHTALLLAHPSILLKEKK